MTRPDPSTYPFGGCHCDHDGKPCGGPAMYEAERDGETVRLCSRCHLPADRNTLRCLLTNDTKVSLFIEYDALGFFVAAAREAEARQAASLN